MQAWSELLEAVPVDTNDETRRRRLQQLCDKVGGLKAVAAAAGTHWQYLDQILKKRLLPKRKDGQRLPAALGDYAARRIEDAFHLTAGWLDWPLESVPFAAWSKLTQADRSYVQGRMLSAIEERAGKVQPEVLVPVVGAAAETGKVFETNTGSRKTPYLGTDSVPYSSVSQKTSAPAHQAALEEAAGYAEEEEDADTRNQRSARPKGRGGA